MNVTEKWIPVTIIKQSRISRYYFTHYESEMISAARAWCGQNYGMEALYSGNWQKHRWWQSAEQINQFWFREEQDATLFALRWA